jgi:hypothetical protein
MRAWFNVQFQSSSGTVQVRPFPLALPRFYSVYIQQQKIVDSRLSVLIDQCELQSYAPFDWAREAEGLAK